MKFARILCCLLMVAPIIKAQQLNYIVSMEDAPAHAFHVTLRSDGIKGPILDLKMPAWMPGYYQILDYGANVSNFHVIDAAGHELPWTKPSFNAWRIGGPITGPFTVTYDVAATKNFVAQPWLDSTRGYIAPAGVFMYINGHMQTPVTVELKQYARWNKIATGLEAVKSRTNTYQAPNFDILYDCPIIAGALDELTPFTVRGIPHYFVGYKLGSFDKAQFVKDLQKIVEQGVAVIGDIPYRHYSFLGIGDGRGGIEHLNSTTIGFSGEALNDPGNRQRTYCFIAHEYFHHYNVKRIRPLELGPFDYDRANNTDQLWVSEGISVYYEYMLVRRASLMSAQDLFHHFQKDISAYENSTGHLYQSLARASLDTWSDGPFGKPNDSVVKTISYYQKGPAIGLLLDFAIRHYSGNKKNLDDVMRTMYQTYYQQKKRGFTGPEFRAVCEAIAGARLDEIFDYVYTTKDPNYAKYLGYGGLGIDTKTWNIFPLAQTDALQTSIRKSWLGE